MNTISFKNSEVGTSATVLEPNAAISAVLLSNDNNLQQVSIEELRDAYEAGKSSGPSIEITIYELLVRFKAELDEQTKI